MAITVGKLQGEPISEMEFLIISGKGLIIAYEPFSPIGMILILALFLSFT